MVCVVVFAIVIIAIKKYLHICCMRQINLAKKELHFVVQTQNNAWFTGTYKSLLKG